MLENKASGRPSDVNAPCRHRADRLPCRRCLVPLRLVGRSPRVRCLLATLLMIAGCGRPPAPQGQHPVLGASIPAPAHPPPGGQEWQPTVESLRYFLELAFATEFGRPVDQLRTWAHTVRVSVDGQLAAADMAEVDAAIAEINAASGQLVIMRIANEGSPNNVDVRLAFVDSTLMQRQTRVRGAEGYTHLWWDASARVYSGRIWIRSDLSAGRRHHAIREELAQSLGLLNDSWRYPDSMFYQGRTTLITFSPLDREVLRLLAENRRLIGLSRSEVAVQLEAKYRVRIGSAVP